MDTLDLRDVLRHETRDLHVETEAIALRVLESEADGYIAFLKALHALHLAADELGRRIPPDVPSFAELDLSARSVLLEQDLAELGFPSNATRRAELDLRTPAELLGLLYVLEDSTLGGTTAARRVRALWHVLGRGTPPLRYLSSEGLDVGARWRTFVRCVGEFSVAHPEAHGGVIDAARRTFAELQKLLLQAGPQASAVPQAL